MLPELLKRKLALTREECDVILARGTSGVLSLHGLHGYPYPVPMSYLYYQGKLWFHAANKGYKLDCFASNPKASFCVIDKDIIVPEQRDSWFQSVNVFGTLEQVEDASIKEEVLMGLVRRYAPGYEKEGQEDLRSLWNATTVLSLSPEQITGKAAREILEQEWNR